MWISAGDHIPARWDLQLIGWESRSAQLRPDLPRMLDGRDAWRVGDWRGASHPERTIAVGVDCAEERAAMLAHGFADALSAQVSLSELSVRLTRIRNATEAMPRRRNAGPLVLDLFHRDARAGERWLSLHPREFALLWHLAGRAGERASRCELLSEVWRLRHVPQTNALEVHVSRLRAKLTLVGLGWLVETDTRGGYRLALEEPDDQFWTRDRRLRRAAGA